MTIAGSYVGNTFEAFILENHSTSGGYGGIPVIATLVVYALGELLISGGFSAFFEGEFLGGLVIVALGIMLFYVRLKIRQIIRRLLAEGRAAV